MSREESFLSHKTECLSRVIAEALSHCLLMCRQALIFRPHLPKVQLEVPASEKRSPAAVEHFHPSGFWSFFGLVVTTSPQKQS